MPTDDSLMATTLRRAMHQNKYVRLAEAVKSCSACSLGTQGPGVPGTWVNGHLVKSEGEVVMVLGEAPGAVEMARGKPFVGQSGELLRSMLKEVGL
ncbi:hypothetical protein LCGC14_1475970, partial [marine sediment metagenome]